MTPKAAVDRLIEILSTLSKPTESEIYAAMKSAGIPPAVADRAYQFAQVAWGRMLLDGLGAKFGPDYILLNKFGDEMDSGILADEPYFAAALAAYRQQPPSTGMVHVASMSADVAAINNALNGGSKPEDLVTGPAVLFTEPPTEAGMLEAQWLLNSRLNPAGSRPWWKFW